MDKMLEDFMTTEVTTSIDVNGVSDRYLKKYGETNRAINRRIRLNASKKLVLEMIDIADSQGKPVPKRIKNKSS
jgi:hypothetical protein